MHILILNWRDIRNPRAGGAEILTHELAKRWVKSGEQVTQISAMFAGGQETEMIDGVRIHRMGRWWSVHMLAAFYYIRHLRTTVDVIVDEVHWFPFFAGLYARGKTVLLACEVARASLFRLFSWPVALWWRTLERMYLLLYRGIPTMAISPSTKTDLIEEGFDARDITVLPMGITRAPRKRVYKKYARPTLIFIGRLNPLKGIEDALDVLHLLRAFHAHARMIVIGRGDPSYMKTLHTKIARLKLRSALVFEDHVSEAKKFEYYGRSHVLLHTSKHEGFGLTVPEAGSVGTPTVAYDVAGLRDIITPRSGVLVHSREEMVHAIRMMLDDPARYRAYQKAARSESDAYTWDRTASVALTVLQKRI